MAAFVADYEKNLFSDQAAQEARKSAQQQQQVPGQLVAAQLPQLPAQVTVAQLTARHLLKPLPPGAGPARPRHASQHAQAPGAPPPPASTSAAAAMAAPPPAPAAVVSAQPTIVGTAPAAAQAAPHSTKPAT